MINWIINKYADVNNREKTGIVSSVVGIICNIILCVLKLIMGLLSNSVSVISDAVNNLSDCISCIITLASFKLAAQPADKEHPFGHGRFEYLSSLLMATFIIVVGVEFFKTSFDRILHYEPTSFSLVILLSLVFSVGVKVWMYFFNNRLGKMISSDTLIASSQDSLSDAFTTTVTIISLIASQFTTFPVDGIIGVGVSLLVLKAGIGIIKDSVDTLLGKPADEETIQGIKDIVLAHPEVMGIHDLIVHDYGPGRRMASLHAEVDAHVDIMTTHEKIDAIEHELYNKMKIMTTIHMDPVDLNDPKVIEYKQIVEDILKEVDPELSMHDFRVVSGPNHDNLVFDILRDFKDKRNNHELKEAIDEKLHQIKPQVDTVITFDSQF